MARRSSIACCVVLLRPHDRRFLHGPEAEDRPARCAKPLTTRAALALAKSQAYQDAADAPATLRAYVADLANFAA